MADSNVETLQAYCVKCRTKRNIDSSEPVYTKTGTPGTRGRCAECGTKLFRMGATAAHESVPKPEKIERPKRKKSKPKARKKKRSKSAAKSNGRNPGRRARIDRLVIVESPAKARSIGGFLGKGYTVLSSVGHVRDLLKSRLSVDVENDFEPEYRVPNEKRAVVKELKAAAEVAEEIYLATDPDREGEAIAWHLVAAAEMPTARIKRVVFHEITDGAVAEAFAHPRQINADLVNAQQARRILDRLVGYQVSQLLWSKVRNGLSAGRVQSIALRLVVEREDEIAAFKPREYWTIDAALAKKSKSGDGGRFTASLAQIDDIKVTFDTKGADPPVLDSEATVEPHVAALRQSLFQVAAVKRGTRQSKPPPPFTTSTLQQAASNSRSFGASRTMRLAQQLYEGIDLGQGSSVGLITYMRTDSVQVSKDAQTQARNFVKATYGPEFVPGKPPTYKTRAKGAQEAHEAIRPTSVERTPASLAGRLDRAQLQIYTMIWNRFVASQMAPAVYDTLRIEVRAGRRQDDMPYLFRASGSKLKFAGHLAVRKNAADNSGGGRDEQQQRFPDLAKGEWLERRDIIPEQHFTQPPSRYNEASLIRQLEELGIGRPSTYAPTVTVIQTRDYVTQVERRLHPTKTGRVVCELLTEFFQEEMDYAFTAKMEDQLDEVSKGKLDWRPMLGEFYQPFEKRLANARENMPRRDVAEKVGRKCPTCTDGDLVVKHSRYGKFIGCSNYPDCKHTERFLQRKGLLCPDCGAESQGEIVERRTRKGRVFFGCSRYPDCDYTTWRLPRNLKPVDPPPRGLGEKEPAVV
ncbi:MAG: type I DNA topoisomerase [Chloroflexi bacterium]|nr:type I DNA topoisomerase [Chloroflexota bacterium]